MIIDNHILQCNKIFKKIPNVLKYLSADLRAFFNLTQILNKIKIMKNWEVFASFVRGSLFAQPGTLAQDAPLRDFQDRIIFIFSIQFLFRHRDGAKCLDKLKAHYARERNKIA